MLAPLLWLSPAARDLLRNVSKLLEGAVPSPPARLAGLLQQAENGQFSGLLADAALRKELAAELEKKGGISEISDKTAAGLVDVLGAVLTKRIEAINKNADALVAKLPKSGVSYRDLMALLPKGEQPGQALRQDWLLWHAVGHAHSPESLPELTAAVAGRRFAIAASAGGGAVAESALALHVLENVDAYVAWEASLPGSKPQGVTKATKTSFDERTAAEVAMRRVLASAVSYDVATTVSVEVTGGADLKATLLKRAEAERASAVLPLYSAPPAPKGAKDAKDAKEGKEAKDGKEGKAAATAASATPEIGRPLKCPPGSLGKIHQATATHELHLALVAYRMRPVTTLSLAAAAPSPAQQRSAKGGKQEAKGSAPAPAGFAGTWAPVGTTLPPGHTPYSWQQQKAQGMKEGFATTWSPLDGEVPPGHTVTSWAKGAASAPSGSTATSSKASSKAAKAEAAATAPAAKEGKAKAPAAPAPVANGDAPAEGSDEAALCKIDLRCGRILECGRVPDADSLYLLKVNVGEAEPRQVVTGLVKYYKEEELLNRQVLVYCNIKPVKMRGFESQAMVLASSQGKGTDDAHVKLLAVPEGTAEGTRPTFGDLKVGSLAESVSLKNISKVWTQVQPLLLTNDKCEATFKGTVLKLGEAPVTTSLPNAPIS